MSAKPQQISDQRERVRRVARVFYGLSLLAAGFIGGTWLAQSRNTNDALSARLSPKGQAFGYVMPTVKLDRPTFRQAITTLAALSHANLQIDWESLKRDGVICDEPMRIQLDLRNVTLDQLLPKVVNAADELGSNGRIAYQAEQGKLIISTPDGLPPTAPLRIYDVRDIIEADRVSQQEFPDDFEQSFVLDQSPAAPLDASAGFIKLIEDTIAPDSWQDAGGTVGRVSVLSGKLVVIQTPENQIAIATLLSQLREGRGHTHETLPDPPDTDPWPRPDLSRKIGELPMHGTLRQAVTLLRQKSGDNIFVNWADVVVDPDETIDATTLHDATIEQGLQTVVAAMNKHHSGPDACEWAIRQGFVVIASHQNLNAEILYMVVYPIGDLINRSRQPGMSRDMAEADLVAKIRLAIAPGEWDQPAAPEMTRLWAGELIVRQTIQHHRELQQFLDKMREAK